MSIRNADIRYKPTVADLMKATKWCSLAQYGIPEEYAAAFGGLRRQMVGLLLKNPRAFMVNTEEANVIAQKYDSLMLEAQRAKGIAKTPAEIEGYRQWDVISITAKIEELQHGISDSYRRL